MSASLYQFLELQLCVGDVSFVFCRPNGSCLMRLKIDRSASSAMAKFEHNIAARLNSSDREARGDLQDSVARSFQQIDMAW